MIGFLNKKTAIYWLYINLFYKYLIFINLFKIKKNKVMKRVDDHFY